MYKESFIGFFSVEPDFIASMPLRHDCGLWQVWEMPDGDYMVQPVDEHYTPVGDSYLLDRMDFIAMLAPVQVPMEGHPLPEQVPAIDAASPDLLDFWYSKQDKAAGPPHDGIAADGPADGMGDDDAENLMSDALESTPVAVDERLFSPVRHPDKDLMEQDRKERMPPEYLPDDFIRSPGNGTAARDKGFFSGLFGKKTGSPPSSAHKQSGKPGSGANPASLFPDRKNTDARSMALLEKSMRAEFERLVKQAQEHPQPDLEEDIADLLAREAPFSEQQKFLFSEFGLALRRKHKLFHALTAHKRALALAPDDENVLFNVARAEYELGNIENAKRCLEKAISLAPGFSSAAIFLSFLNGTLLEGEKHP